jgi:hypothetical protein
VTGVQTCALPIFQKPKKLYPEELREYIKNNPDKTLKEIGATLGASDYR